MYEVNLKEEEKVEFTFDEGEKKKKDSSDLPNKSKSGKKLNLSNISGNWSNIVQYIILGLVFLLPVWVLPFSGAPLGFSKSLLIYVAVIGAAIIYLIHILQEGSFSFPKSIIFFAVLAILAVSLVSALFSGNITLSVFGTGSEVDTFVFILVLSVGLFLIASLFQSEQKIFMFFFLLFGSALSTFVFQFFQSIVGWTLLPWDLFARKADNLVGSWNELSIFFGLVALLSIIFFEFFNASRRLRIFLISVMATSLLAMMFVNFTTAWIVFGLFMLIFLVYLYSSSKQSRNFARLPLFIVLLVVFFVLARVLIGDLVSSAGLDTVEVRPSWGATMQVSLDSIKEGVKNMVFGSGLNTFVYDWLKHKPLEINRTIFWNVRFNSGIGLIPSFLATVGILGVLAWLAFLGTILYYAFRAINYAENNTTKCFLMASLLGSVYLWVFSVVYVPNNFIFALSFLMTGLFLAMLVKIGKLQTKKISFINNTSLGFISALVIVLLMILGVASFYLLFQKYWAAYSYTRGVVAFSTEGNLEKAQTDFLRAVRFDKQDRYHRSLAELGLLRMSEILNQQGNPEELRSIFQNTLAFTIQHAQNAKDINQLDPLNWTLLGRIYESVIPLQIGGAQELAISSYDEAFRRGGPDPRPLLSAARVKMQIGDTNSARAYLISALEKKGDYTPALFLLAQIEARDGNLDVAILQTEQARLFAPNDIGILFQLGLLYYQKENYDRARAVLERTVMLNPNYANASYFLGLIYDKQGFKQDAIAQFEVIQQLNPGNAEVQAILTNLKAGRGALQTISPPAPPPEEREELPVEEEELEEEVTP
jgi:tetratricopeptide (TPR) repeat protein